MSYATGTVVPVERTKAEIERMLKAYGCSSFQSGWDTATQSAHVMFRHGETGVMLGIEMPKADEFSFTERGRKRTKESATEAWHAEVRRRWRALLLIIKAKMEAVECGITTLEKEFLADIVMPNGQTIGATLLPRLAELQAGRLALPAHDS